MSAPASGSADDERGGFQRARAWVGSNALITTLIVGVAVALVLAAVLQVNDIGGAGGSRGSGEDSSAAVTDTSDSETVETLDPEQQCVEVVMRVLSEVPQALSEGYNAGIDPSPLITQYGTEGRVFNAFVQGQALLMGKIASEGDPDRQLASVLVDVDEICHDDGRFDDAPAEGLSGLQ